MIYKMKRFRQGMKSAISVTLDDESIRYLATKVGKRSNYINQMIISEMQKTLELQKTVWVKCPDCHLPVKDGEKCPGCLEIVLAQQTLEEFE